MKTNTIAGNFHGKAFTGTQIKALTTVFLFTFLLTTALLFSGYCLPYNQATGILSVAEAKSFPQPRKTDAFCCPIKQIPDLDKGLNYRNFRTVRDELKAAAGKKQPSLKGLKELNMSGSSQFNRAGLTEMVKKINHKNIVVMDLREECHGFLDGSPMSWKGYHNWANIGFGLMMVTNEELARLHGLRDDKNEVNNEEQECKKAGTGYFRIPVTDHIRPQDDDVDRFITFVNSMDKDTWLHFHCRAGKGRTTTFMCMFDMMRNAKEVSLEDITLRQLLIGGADLFKGETPDSYKYELAAERMAFLRNFYKYCKENNDGYKTSWRDWIKRKKTKNY